MHIKQEYYDVLNSSRTDSLDKIKENYKTLCLKYHPDVGGSEDYMKEINLAMDIINEFHKETTNTNNFKSTNGKNNAKKNYNANKTSNNNNKKNQHKNSSRKHKTNTKKNHNKNNGRCSRCNSKYESYAVYCTQCGQKIRHKKDKDNNNEDIELLCIGVVIIGVGLLLLSVFWPIGIIYFYILYKYITG